MPILSPETRLQDFLFWEEITSPDGYMRVMKGYRDGERTPLLAEPRIIDIASGRIVVDLWRTYHNYQVQFRDAGKVRLIVEDPNQTTARIIDIDVARGMFAFANSPHRQEPLAALRDRIVRQSA